MAVNEGCNEFEKKAGDYMEKIDRKTLGMSKEFEKEMSDEEFKDFMLFRNNDHTLNDLHDTSFFYYEPEENEKESADHMPNDSGHSSSYHAPEKNRDE